MAALVSRMSDEREAGEAMRRRLVAFVQVLRNNGFATGFAETRDALALLADPIAQRSGRLRPAFRALFCSRRSDWEKFDEIFAAFWLARGIKSALRTSGASPHQPAARSQTLAPGDSLSAGEADRVERVRSGAAADITEGQSRREGASSAESLAKTDFRHMTDPAEVEAAYALAGRLARSMRVRLTRRHRAHRTHGRLDFRRTIHHSIPHGGTPIELYRRRRKHKPLRLVILLDASGSMSLYAPVFLRFMHGVLDTFLEAEAFVFHTRLTHISPALREKNAARAVERLSLIATGMGGGTRIGDSLATFNRWHARRMIHSRTAVLIVSDGYDTGEPARLGAEMRLLRRRCRRIAWLNPMLGWQDYAPEARGMKAALPYIDLFAPAHNLESLVALEPYLARL
ncbi:carbon monoxide dehydrogenase [Beijerinckiaceae bacterium]|nr:carbon monoxide dehydrogenase [Beijerinckiaceae bacterium]